MEINNSLAPNVTISKIAPTLLRIRNEKAGNSIKMRSLDKDNDMFKWGVGGQRHFDEAAQTGNFEEVKKKKKRLLRHDFKQTVFIVLPTYVFSKQSSGAQPLGPFIPVFDSESIQTA